MSDTLKEAMDKTDAGIADLMATADFTSKYAGGKTKVTTMTPECDVLRRIFTERKTILLAIREDVNRAIEAIDAALSELP